MGAWGSGVFDNDEALDWASDLLHFNDLKALSKAIDTVIKSEDYVEAPDAENLLCACEILAVLNGKSPTTLPDDVCNWVKTHETLNTLALIPDALLALEKVTGENSELFQLLQENEQHFSVWYETVRSIKEYLEKRAAAENH